MTKKSSHLTVKTHAVITNATLLMLLGNNHFPLWLS